MATTLHDLRTFGVTASDGFSDWLTANGSIVLTRPPNLVLIGTTSTGALTVDTVPFGHPTGLAVDGPTMWLATGSHVWRLEDALAGDDQPTADGCDACFLPQVGAVTGFIDVHDLAMCADRQPLLVSSRFSCLARLADPLSFAPTWLPPWVSAIAPEDRCHLTGVAMLDGQATTATAAAVTDDDAAWREHRRDGGVAVDVPTGEVVARGLSLPQSPRWHDGRLWLANAGAGQLGVVDTATNCFEPVLTLPTFLRGLTFTERHALVCGSGSRSGDLLDGLPIGDRLSLANARPEQGVYVVDTASGEVVHSLSLEGTGREIFSIALLPGVRRAKAISLGSDDVQTLITYDAAWEPHDAS